MKEKRSVVSVVHLTTTFSSEGDWYSNDVFRFLASLLFAGPGTIVTPELLRREVSDSVVSVEPPATVAIHNERQFRQTDADRNRLETEGAGKTVDAALDDRQSIAAHQVLQPLRRSPWL
jgi:hypothetical protein